jgi:quercetin dioxygenase-like cupin family protein
VLLCAVSSSAQTPAAVIKHPGEIQWKVSGTLPPSAEYALIYEDPVTRGVQLLVRFPSGYVLPIHSHGQDETILVIKGKLIVDLGQKPQTLEAGAYATIPAGLNHSLRAKGACVLLVTVTGPCDVKGLPSVKD